MRRLEIGPGTHPRKGFDTLDVVGAPTYRAKWGREKLPIEDQAYDYVYASHCLEHVPWYRTDFALSEVFRILRPGGTVEIHTIDFALLVEAYQCRTALDEWTCHGLNPKNDPIKWIASRLFAYQIGETQENWHRAIFDGRYLKQCLSQAGFVRIEPCEPPVNHHGIVNLGMKGIKP